MKLRKCTYLDYYSNILNLLHTNSSSISKTQFIEYLSKNNLYVLEDNNKIVAFASINYMTDIINNNSKYAFVDNILVENIDYEKELSKEIITLCKQRDCYKILVNKSDDFIEMSLI